MRLDQPFLFFYLFAYLEIVLLIEPVRQLNAMNMACFFANFGHRCTQTYPKLTIPKNKAEFNCFVIQKQQHQSISNALSPCNELSRPCASSSLFTLIPPVIIFTINTTMNVAIAL